MLARAAIDSGNGLQGGAAKERVASLDGELITAIVSAVASATAAGVAVWQAREARGAAHTARVQANAAEEQVELMRRQIDADKDARKEASGPQFQILSGLMERTGRARTRVKLVLKQTSGPALESVVVGAVGPLVMGMSDDPSREGYDGDYAAVQAIVIGPIGAGGTETLFVDLGSAPSTTTIVLHLDCQARNSDASWARSAAMTVSPPRDYFSYLFDDYDD